jgi:hypothetical protein
MADGDHACTVDPAERELASAQLDELALANEGLPWTAWKEAVLGWHMQTLASAREDSWIPGLVGCSDDDQLLKRFLSRFYLHHSHATIQRLRAENMELRRKVTEAAACMRFYATGAVDDGCCAAKELSSLLSDATAARPAKLVHLQRR